MKSWTEFEREVPELAARGHRLIYQVGIGLGFLATVRADGAPRVHPVCPVISEAGLHLLVVGGPKQQDLLRDGRYGLHCETCPPPHHEDGFLVSGRAVPVTDPGEEAVARAQVRMERGGEVWASFDQDKLFRLELDRCLLILTISDGLFPAGPTVWRLGGN